MREKKRGGGRKEGGEERLRKNRINCHLFAPSLCLSLRLSPKHLSLSLSTLNPPLNLLNQTDSPAHVLTELSPLIGWTQVLTAPEEKLQNTCTASLLQPPLGSIQ